MQYFLGGDIGSSKTHVLISNQNGLVVGFGEGGAGNHETVGYEGFVEALSTATQAACQDAGITLDQVTAAGFGVSGYDWPSEKEATYDAIRSAGIQCPFMAVNDAILGLLAGSEAGWGLAVVSGTGCNCRGWDRERQREGMVTGNGFMMGEGAGGSELMHRAVQAVSHEWTKRGCPTAISQALIRDVGASSLADLVEGLSQGYYTLDASAAPLIFAVASAGDQVAIDLIRWAGCELGELAKSVIRQLAIEDLEFEIVLVGSMFKGGPLLIDPMFETIHAVAPKARLVPLTAPPVAGAVLLAMEQVNSKPDHEIRQTLIDTFTTYTMTEKHKIA
jgi:N-acetylglucosamine kinase-like BadF-type ATPase